MIQTTPNCQIFKNLFSANEFVDVDHIYITLSEF
jgi:hypothetical protein